MEKGRKIIRAISFYVAVILCFEAVCPPDIALALQTKSSIAGVVHATDRIILPNFTRAEWVRTASIKPSQAVVYLIQDAHTSLLAQQRITQTLEHLRNQKALDAVLIEGVSEKITAERFTHISDLSKQTDLITNLERQGYLHGAAAFALLNPEVSAIGMESPELYRTNFELFREVMKSEKEVQRAVSAFQVEWQRWLKLRTQKEDYDFFLNSASAHAFSENSGYFEQLIAVASRELGIQWNVRDQKEWPSLIRLQRMLEVQPKLNFKKARVDWLELKKLLPTFTESNGRIIDLRMSDEDFGSSVSSDALVLRRFAAQLVQELIRKRLPLMPYRAFFDWLAIVTFQAEIEPEGLIREIEKIEEQIWNKKFQAKEDRRSAKLGRMAMLFDQAGRLELSRGAVSRFRAMVESDDFKFWISKLLPEKKKFILDFSAHLLQFYAVAERREDAFVKKLNRAVETAAASPSSIPHIAVVVGGFHKEGLLNALKGMVADIAVLSPKLDRIDNDVAYRERMLESAIEFSTLSMVPAAVVKPAELMLLVGEELAPVYEADLQAALAVDSSAKRSEMRPENLGKETGSAVPSISRRSFGLGVISTALLAGLAEGQDAIDQLLKQAGDAPAVKASQADFKAAIFPVADLQLGASGGMEGYLAGMMNRIGRNLPGLKNKWTRVLAEVERMRVNRISLMASYSPSAGLQGGLRISSMAGDVLEISDGGLSLVMKTIGFLLDEILVNPVLNQADAASIRSSELSYQWKMTQLAGEAARLILMLKAAESKLKVLEAYIQHLTQAEKQIRALMSSGSATDEQVNNVSSFLNEAKDSKGSLEVEMTQAREGLKMLLGADFDSEKAPVPVPVRAWLNSSERERVKLIASAQSRVGRVLSVQSSVAQIETLEATAKAEKRRGLFSFFFRRGPAKPDQTRKDLGLSSEKLSNNPDVARAQVLAESEQVQSQVLTQELKSLVQVEATKFAAAHESHARWQKQVYEEQLAWRTRGLLAADYDLDMLTLLKRSVQAQLRVLETRAQMSGAAVVWTTAGLEDQSAGSQNWMNPVLFSGFFPAGYVPVALPAVPKRSEVRGMIRQSVLWVVQIIGFLSLSFSALAQQPPVVSGAPGSVVRSVTAGVARVWEEKGKIHMSSEASEKPDLMRLKFPEVVLVDPSGKMKLSSEGQLRYEHLKRDFEADLRAYTNLKSGGAKLSELLPRFKLLLEKGLELDRFERMVSAMTLLDGAQFKVVQKHPGTYGVNQSVMEIVSTRIATLKVHMPLRELLGSKIQVEVDGQKGALISRPKVLEVDALGAEGSAVIELNVAVDQPLALDHEIAYRVWLERDEKGTSVSHGEPAEILIQDGSGSEVSAGVALLLRERIPVVMPDYGSPELQSGLEFGSIEEGGKVANIPFERSALFDFFISESHSLGDAAKTILPSVSSTGVFTQQQISQLTQDAEIARVVSARLNNQRVLMSSANGVLEVSPELASGFPMNQGDPAAWVQTHRVLLRAAVAGNAPKIEVGGAIAVRLADGRKIEGKIQSVSAEDKAHLYGRRSFVAEFDLPVGAGELDWDTLLNREGVTPTLLFSLLAKAQRESDSALNQIMSTNAELSGGMGVGASMVPGMPSPARAPTLADLIAANADSVQAHQLFKQHQSGFGAEDYQVLLESKHLSLVYETVKLLLRERGEWAEVMRAFDAAERQGDLGRSRALYDAVVTALVSGGHEIESGLAKLGIQSRGDESLRQISESVFLVLAADRGLNDIAARRVLDSSFWNAAELLQFAANIQAGSAPEMRGIARGVFEMIWRARAGEQILAIHNSAYWGKMLAGRDPEHVLTWLDEDSILDELVYRKSLQDDQRVLRDGMISEDAVIPPAIANLIDLQTAEKVSLPTVKPNRPATLLRGVLGTRPVTLGELDVLSVEQQEQAMRAAASRGDLELLTWILSSRMSGHLKQTAISILQNTEHGPLVFARWFARQSDASLASSMLKSYGVERFLADLTSEIITLEKEIEDEDKRHSLAPSRQNIFEALFRLYVRDVYPLRDKQSETVLRQLLMLVSDPADLAKLARGEKPASPEARKVKMLSESVFKNAVLEELTRRSLLAATAQFSLLNQSRAMVGEIRPEEVMNQLSMLQALLQPDAFAEKMPFAVHSDAEAVAAIKEEFAKHMTNGDQAAKLSELAAAHFQAAWTGKVKVPSASGHQAGFVWTIFSYTKNIIGLFVLGIFSWLFFRQSVVRARKIKAMQRGEAVQFYDSLAAWKKDFEEEILQSGVVKDGEGKNRVVLGLNEWSDLLSSSNPDYPRIFELAQSVFSWPNLSLRLENFKGFRHDDRQRDRILIYALTSLSYLTLKHLSERDEVSGIQDKIYHFLKDRSHRLVIFSYILFQLKNLKENESYNAVEPNIANSAIQKLRLKAYRFQQRVWPPVRKIYAMDKASQKIRHSLTMLVAEYENLSAQIGDPSGSANSDQIRKVIEARYNPREPWGKSPDNATIAGDRKLATRIFNFVAALGSIPAILGQVHLIFVLFPMVGSSGVAAIVLPLFFLNAIMLFSAFTYLSHLYANLANLHDVQAEEFLDHLSRVQGLMEIKPRSETPTSALPASALRARASQPSPPKESLRKAVSVPAPQPSVIAEDPILDGERVLSQLQPKTGWTSLLSAGAPVIVAGTALARDQSAKKDEFQTPVGERDIDWVKSISDWNRDASLAAVVFFIPEGDQADAESKRLNGILKSHGMKKFAVTDELDSMGEEDLLARIPEVATEITGVNDRLAGKVVFVRQSADGVYFQMKETVEIPFEPKKPQLTESPSAIAGAAPVDEKPLKIEDLLAELGSLQKNPGFDAVVVTVNQEDADALRPVIKNLIQKTYGYSVPVAVIGSSGVNGGNGVPALGAFTDQTRMNEELRRDNPNLPGVDEIKLIVLEAYGPDLDIANLTAGSIFLSPTGINDHRGSAVTTGALALARAAISMREVKTPAQFRFKTDTYNLNRLRVHLPGDITFAVTKLPAHEVVGRFGVPIFSDKKPTKIKGFFEKVDTLEKLQYLYKQRTGLDITADTQIPVFTGDIALQFKSREKQIAFQSLTRKLESFFKTTLRSNPAFQFDEVLDLWVPLIMAENKSKADIKDLLVSYAGYRAKISRDGKPRVDHERLEATKVYSELYFEILNQVQQSDLKLSIHGIVDKGEFSDVRDVEPLTQLNLSNRALIGLQTEKAADSDVLRIGDEKVTTFGLNGNRPSAYLKDLLMASVPMRRGSETFEAIVYGMRGAWGVDRLRGFEETHLGFDTRLFKDENGQSFLEGIPFRQMPLFPTRMTQPEQTNRLVTAAKMLNQGQAVRVKGGAAALRRAGYVSLDDILKHREVRGLQAPVHTYAVEGPARRSELRTLTQLIRTGAAAAALVVFYGILPPKAGAAAVKLESHAATIMLSAWNADKRALILEGLGMIENNSVAEVNAQQTLFVDGSLLSGREILAELKTLSEAAFRIELLFTQASGYESARRALDGKTELGKLKIRLGATIGEMVSEAAAAQTSEALDMKKNFAFLGKDEAMARRLRAHVANLMILKQSQAIPANILLEALLSPAIFSLNFRLNKIWSMDLVLPMLLAARQIARSA